MAEQSGDDDNRIDLDRTHAAALNLAVLQRIDPATVSIVATANHVAIYAFNTASQQWAKRNVEGACFVVERDGVPQHRVVVMNRTSRSNFVFDVVSTLQLKLVKPYLMLKDSANDEAGVNGIWFQDEAERKAVTQALARLLRGSGGAAPAPAAAGDPLEKVAAPSGVVAGRTLLSMVQASPAAGASASLPQVPLPVSGSGMPAPASAAAPRLAPAAGLAPAAAALFSSFAASQREQQQRAAAVAAAPSAAVVAAPAPDVPPAPSTPSMLLTRAQLRDALLELLGDDSFVADLHSRYLTTAARQAGSGR